MRVFLHHTPRDFTGGSPDLILPAFFPEIAVSDMKAPLPDKKCAGTSRKAVSARDNSLKEKTSSSFISSQFLFFY